MHNSILYDGGEVCETRQIIRRPKWDKLGDDWHESTIGELIRIPHKPTPTEMSLYRIAFMAMNHYDMPDTTPCLHNGKTRQKAIKVNGWTYRVVANRIYRKRL